MEQITKGIFLKAVVKYVSDAKGEAGIKLLEQNIGQSLQFSSIKSYPVSLLTKLHHEAAKIIYGKLDDEAMFKLGKLSVSTYTNSLLGKTMFSLLGNNFRTIAMSAAKMYKSVTSGIEVETKELQENKIKITIRNDPFEISYSEGLFTTITKQFGFTPTIISKKLNDTDNEFILEWN